jgi:hypothetical protein
MGSEMKREFVAYTVTGIPGLYFGIIEEGEDWPGQYSKSVFNVKLRKSVLPHVTIEDCKAGYMMEITEIQKGIAL